MAVEGTLDLFKLPEILQLISQQKKTGILTVQGQQDIVAISFLTGRIVAADALNQPLEEGLSQILLKEGMIGAPDLGRASAEHQSSGGRLIDLLVERRYIERAQLLEALRLQTSRLLEQLMRWSQGDFKFYSGDEVSYEEGFEPISVEELLIHAAQHAPAPPKPRPAPALVPPPQGPPGAPQATPAQVAVPPQRPAPPAPSPPPPPVEAIPFSAPRATGTPFPGAEPMIPPDMPPSRVQAILESNAQKAAQARGHSSSSASGETAGLAGIAALVPPDSSESSSGAFRQMKAEPRVVPSHLPAWAGRALAALLTALVVAALLLRPDSLVVPFPWQEHERDVLVRDQRAALYLKIDRAAKTWFLLKGSFPDRLQELVSAGLLAPGDLQDPEGQPLQYLAGEESYNLQPLHGGKPLAGAGETEAITGNFLLDPELLNVTPASAGPPLVLLD
jgi:hypothetical protein